MVLCGRGKKRKRTNTDDHQCHLCEQVISDGKARNKLIMKHLRKEHYHGTSMMNYCYGCYDYHIKNYLKDPYGGDQNWMKLCSYRGCKKFICDHSERSHLDQEHPKLNKPENRSKLIKKKFITKKCKLHKTNKCSREDIKKCTMCSVYMIGKN